MSTNSATKFYAAINKDTAMRVNSTSGGVFSLLAHYVLSEGGVIYGAAYDKDQKVHHIKVTTEDNLHLLQGAKYAPSNVSGIYAQVKADMEAGVLVLFSGTPCQIVGLRNYLKTDYDNLIMVDLVCHGVPDNRAWQSYLEYRKRQDCQECIASEINLRSKLTGWSRYGYSVSFKYPSGFEYTKVNSQDSYMQAFVSNLILRKACNNCKCKGTDRVSDFTLGDFWGVWDYLPIMDDNNGTSLVMIHSEKGKAIWNELQNLMICQEITEQQACDQNSSILYPSSVHLKRDEVLDRLAAEGWEVVEKVLEADRRERAKSQANISLIRRVGHKVKTLLVLRSYA